MSNIQNNCTALFGIRIPTDFQSKKYLAELKKRGLLTPYHGLKEEEVMNIPQPIAIPRYLAEELYSSTQIIMPFLKSEFPTPQQFQQYFESLNMKLLDRKIVPTNLGDRVHKRIHKLNLRPPMTMDAIFTVNDRNVIATVVEFQSTTGICGEIHQSMKAAEAATGYPYTHNWHIGSISPWDGLKQFRRQLVGKKPIYVIDAHSLTDGSIVDRIEMSKVLSDSPPLSFEDIEKDWQGIYFNEKKLENGEVTLTGRKIYSRGEAFFSRITPDELVNLIRELEERGREDKIFILAEFLSSLEVYWAQHPCESCLIDKRQLAKLANFTTEKGLNLAPYFSQKMFNAGEVLPAGDYALKRVDASGGLGTEIIRVISLREARDILDENQIELKQEGSEDILRQPGQLNLGKYQAIYSFNSTISAEERVSYMQIISEKEPFIIPNGWMAQEKFNFLDIDVEVPDSLVTQKTIPGILELRTISLPSPEMEKPPAVFAFRLAPKTNPDRTKIVMTNIGEAMQAHREYMDKAGLTENLREENIRRSPFGMGPAFTACRWYMSCHHR
ncbi:MAG: hypothetical protein QNJ54_13115 [Prochloraceae cyanobacterium]|nr:hypothetical protein [Prochloraceae cyanobacterium]